MRCEGILGTASGMFAGSATEFTGLRYSLDKPIFVNQQKHFTETPTQLFSSHPSKSRRINQPHTTTPNLLIIIIENRPLQHRRRAHRPNHNRRPHSSDRRIRRLKHKSSEIAHSSNSIQTRRRDGDVRVCFVVVFPGGGGFVFCYSDGDTEAEIREDGEEIEG